MHLPEWTENQRRVFIDAVQIHDAWREADRKARAYRGGMHWKTAKGRQYLFRTRDRYGYGKSLGPRSPETEQILADFQRGKADAKERLTHLRARLAEQARFCKAARLDRVPKLVTAILRLLDGGGLLGKNLMVAGTHAMYAYEAAAGVWFDSAALATGDMDLLWDVRPRLRLAGNPDSDQGLLGILRKADRSFEALSQGNFRAVNRDGFMVDLIKAEPRKIHQKEPRRMGEDGDLVAAEIPNLQWLLASPKLEQTVIGGDGFPARMAAPDPRAFAIHKIWLGDQPSREPVKRRRDREQGRAVAVLAMGYLPDRPFKNDLLRMLPKSVVDAARRDVERDELPPGFGEE
ncbi:MAG: GSU2403 family nucleotidyltransferase fold protein [Desulfococcaceae bacterium]